LGGGLTKDGESIYDFSFLSGGRKREERQEFEVGMVKDLKDEIMAYSLRNQEDYDYKMNLR